MTRNQASWDTDGELTADAYPGTVIIHHTALGVLIDAPTLEHVSRAIAPDYESELHRFDIRDAHGVEEDALCLVIWPGFDRYSQIMAKIQARLG